MEVGQVLEVGIRSSVVAMLRRRNPLDIQAEMSSWRSEPMERSRWELSMDTWMVFKLQVSEEPSADRESRKEKG